MLATLVHDPFYEEVPRFFGMPLKDLLALKDPTSWVEFERGEIDEATYFGRFFADGRSYDAPGLRACVESHFRWLDGMEALLGELRDAGATMHVLSNYPSWYELIERKLGLARFVPWTFVSCKTGVRKPDAESFLGPARALGVEPGACLLIDDREVNCEGARAVGMPAIRFEGAAALRSELVSRGLI